MSDTEAIDIKRVSRARCWELLARANVGRLAVTIAGAPDIFPVNYALDDHRIVIRTAPGTKLAAAIDHDVAFEVDVLDERNQTGWSVVVRGHAVEPQHIEDYLSALDLDIHTWAAGTRDRFIVIEPSVVTGRALPPAVTSGWSCTNGA